MQPPGPVHSGFIAESYLGLDQRPSLATTCVLGHRCGHTCSQVHLCAPSARGLSSPGDSDSPNYSLGTWEMEGAGPLWGGGTLVTAPGLQ